MSETTIAVTPESLDAAIITLAQQARAAGIPSDDGPHGQLAGWLQAHVRMRPEQVFWVWFLVACAMGRARQEELDRIWDGKA